MDAMYFFRSSLARAAETFGIKYRKLEHPRCVKEGDFPRADEMEYLKEYAIVDAQIAEELGKHIVDYHQQYNVPVQWTVTPASLAAKIYRKSFLKKSIPYQPDFINKLAMLSYNGGRTESFCYGTTDVKVYDINSSYPYAMTQIEIPMQKHTWRRVGYVHEEKPGIYVLSGEIPMQKISPPGRASGPVSPVPDAPTPHGDHMSSRTRVVVTGLGTTNPVGGGVATTWDALIARRSGIRELTEEWAQDLPVRIAGRIAVEPSEVLERVKARRLDRSAQFAVVAAAEAWKDAGFESRGSGRVPKRPHCPTVPLAPTHWTGS